MSLKKAMLNKINTIEIIGIDKILDTKLNDEEFNYIRRLINENPDIFDIIEEKINDALYKYKKAIYDASFMIEIILKIYQTNLLTYTTIDIDIINIAHFTFFDVILESKLFLYSNNY